MPLSVSVSFCSKYLCLYLDLNLKWSWPKVGKFTPWPQKHWKKPRGRNVSIVSQEWIGTDFHPRNVIGVIHACGSATHWGRQCQIHSLNSSGYLFLDIAQWASTTTHYINICKQKDDQAQNKIFFLKKFKYLTRLMNGWLKQKTYCM